MVDVRLERTVDAPIEHVFDLARSVELHTESMAAHDEQVVDGADEGLLAAGDRVTWQSRHFGVPLRMTVELTAMDRPARFTDVQVSGPFARWEHEHAFESTAVGTRVVDDVTFDSPVGPLGTAVDRVVLRHYVRRLLAGRLDHLKSVAESDRWNRFVPAEDETR